MHPENLSQAEVVAAVGGILLGVAVFLSAYVPSANPNISLGIGWFGMMLGALLISGGGALRSAESERRRKPPGVL